MREDKIIAPGITETERFVALVLAIADSRIETRLTAHLSDIQKAQLNSLLQPEATINGKTPFSWLAQPPQKPSAKSLVKLLERVKLLQGINMPPLDSRLHRDRIIELSRKCSKYKSQSLLNLPAGKRLALLVSHVTELTQDPTDEILDVRPDHDRVDE